MDHSLQSPQSAKWVKLHGPPERLLELVEDCQSGDENSLTLAWMARFGWERVRGGSWCAVDLRAPPLDLDSFNASERLGSIKFAPPSLVDDVWMSVLMYADEARKNSQGWDTASVCTAIQEDDEPLMRL